MNGWIVDISHLSDRELEFFGWIRVDRGEEFSTYWNPRYNETQPVENENPRYLIVDDWNDAKQMDGKSIMNAPPKRRRLN